MKFLLSLLSTLLFSFLQIHSVNAQEATAAHRDSLNTIVQAYYDLNLKIFQADSEVADIDNVFALFTEDFTYVHPKYGGVYTREDLYNGYVRNQKNGGYDGSVFDIKIVNQISGLKAVTVEKRFVTKENGQLTESESQMTLFEFKDGKISRVFEYW